MTVYLYVGGTVLAAVLLAGALLWAYNWLSSGNEGPEG